MEEEVKTPEEKRIEAREDILCSIFGHSISIVLVLFLAMGAIGKIGMTESVIVAFSATFALIVGYLLIERVYVK